MSDERIKYFIAMCKKRAMLKAKAEELKAQMEQIDLELKSLDKSEDPYIFGQYKVFWKDTTKTSLDQKALREHNPAAYEKALVTKTSEYFAVK